MYCDRRWLFVIKDGQTVLQEQEIWGMRYPSTAERDRRKDAEEQRKLINQLMLIRKRTCKQFLFAAILFFSLTATVFCSGIFHT